MNLLQSHVKLKSSGDDGQNYFALSQQKLTPVEYNTNQGDFLNFNESPLLKIVKEGSNYNPQSIVFLINGDLEPPNQGHTLQ